MNMKKTTSEPKFTSYQIFLIAMLTILQFTVVLGFAVISPLGDMMMKDLSIDTAQFGLLISGYAFGACLSGIFAASYADKYDRKTFLLFFYVGFLIGLFLCGIARSYYLLLLARTITGVFGGVINSIALAIVADIFALNQRGRVMGYIQMAFSVSQIIGIPIGLVIANKWGWNSTFIVIGVVSIFIGLLILFKMQPITTHLAATQSNKKPLQHMLSILTKRRYFAGFALITLVSLGGSMIMPFSASFLINNVHIGQTELPIFYLASGIASIFIMIYVGNLSDKYPKRLVFLGGAIMTIIMILIFTNLGPQPIWLVIIINILLLSGINGRLIPAMALNSAVPALEDRGGYMSLCSAVQQFANGFGALLSGVIIVQATKTSPLENFNIVGLVVCVAAIICIFLIRQVAKQVGAR